MITLILCLVALTYICFVALLRINKMTIETCDHVRFAHIAIAVGSLAKLCDIVEGSSVGVSDTILAIGVAIFCGVNRRAMICEKGSCECTRKEVV